VLARRRKITQVLDGLVPFLVALFFVLVAMGARDDGGSSSELVAGFALALLHWVALRERRRRPELALAGTVAAGLGVLLVYPEEQILLPIGGLVAIVYLASARPPRVSLVGLAALVALSFANLAESPLGDVLFTVGLSIGAWAIGEAARSRRASIETEARRAVSEEQARIARELHDVIAHSVSVIVVQAAAANDVFERRPEQARAALRAIEHSARDALGELRRLLGAVRPGDDDTRPAPGLDRVDELAAPLRAGGLQVVVRREGPAASLPAGVDLSAYRIVQEALTNTLRHAQATRAEVTLTYGTDAVEVEVRDDGRGADAEGPWSGGGNGLVGMRERTALLGGTLEAGPLPGRGYRVHARLPLESA